MWVIGWWVVGQSCGLFRRNGDDKIQIIYLCTTKKWLLNVLEYLYKFLRWDKFWGEMYMRVENFQNLWELEEKRVVSFFFTWIYQNIQGLKEEVLGHKGSPTQVFSYDFDFNEETSLIRLQLIQGKLLNLYMIGFFNLVALGFPASIW